jgi:tRNA(Ile)-lysidine synthase
MLTKLKNHIALNFPFLEDKKLLLATSGGIDSMVMLHLFQKLNYKIAIAHCNFQLRGAESDGDQKFIEHYASENKILIFEVVFDTKKFALDQKLSTQIAARELRYNWFYELLATENYDYILTAHHADDTLETFLINFTRGTGLDGLTGIPAINEKTIRPLLPFSRLDIENYANENQIKWREDSSNATDNYLRNKIRHHLVPIFKELNPNFLNSFQETSKHLFEAKSLVDDALFLVYPKVVSEGENQKKINLNELLKLPNYKAYLYQWLKPFGFTAWEDIYDLVESQSGKQIFSDKFRLIKDRDYLLISPKKVATQNDIFFIDKNQKEVNFPIKLSFCNVSDISDVRNSVIFVDENKLQFPLTIRKWKTADVFQPMGMNGQSKKVSKFFKDEKLSLLDKENIWLLCSENQIIWIIGLRQDERFKIDTTTKNSLQIRFK